MDNIKKMSKSIVNTTSAIGLVCAIISWVFFGFYACLGVGIGSLLGVFGFIHIVRFCQSIDGDTNGKKAGMVDYTIRYLLYGIVMFSFAYLGIPVLAMLAGFLCHKGAILIYSIHTRKEMDDVSSE